MSIHFDYTVDVQQALDNLDKVEKKTKENIDTINRAGSNNIYPDKVAKPFQEVHGIIAQLKNELQNTGKISRQELGVLQEDLITASDKLRDVEFLNKNILNDLEQGLKKAQIGRYNATNSNEANKYSSQISTYQKYITIHKKFVQEAKKLGLELDTLQEEINKVSSSLNKQEQSTDKTKNASVSFITQLRKMKQELYQMRLAGDTSSEAYKKLSQEIIRMEATRKGATAGLNPLSNYRGIISGMNAISGTTTAVTGALSLFGEKSEKVQAITSKLNALMAITIGLQTIEQTLLSSSAFKINIIAKAKQWWNNLLRQEAVITRALSIERARASTTATAQTVATNAQTIATRKGILASTSFAKSFRMIGLAIKAIPGVGWLLALVGAFTSLGAVYKKKYDEAIQKQKELTQQQEEFEKSVASNTATHIVSFRKLQNEYNALGNNIKAKEKYIKDNKDAFKKLEISVNDVRSAEKLFNEGADDFCNSLKARAKAMAANNLVIQEYEKLLKTEQERDRKVSSTKKYKTVEDKSRKSGSTGETETTVYYTYQVVDIEATKKAQEQVRKEYQKTIDDTKKEIDKLTDVQKNAEKEEDKYLKKSGAKKYKQAEQTKEINKQSDSLREYNTLLDKANKGLRDARNSVIEDETEKRIAQENARFEDEKKNIEKELKDIQVLAKKAGKENLPENIVQGYNERLEIAEKEHNDKIEKIHKYETDKYQQELGVLLNSYADYNEQRLSIDKKYNEDLEKLQKLRKKAEEKGNEADIKRIDNAIKQNKINKTKEVIELDFTQLKATPEYVRAFEDLENTSTETIRYLIQEFDKVKQVVGESLDPKDLQEYIDVLEKMQAELDRRDTFTAITNARIELKTATEELTQAEKEYETVEKNFGKGSQEELVAIKKVISAKDKQAKAGKKLNNAETSLLNSIKDLASGFKELGDSISGEFGDAISTIGDMGVTILNTILQLKALEIQARNTEVAIRSLETATVVLAAVSATLSVVTTLYNKFFNKEDDSYDRAKSAMEGYIEVLDKVIDKERELMNFYAGKTGEKAYEKAQDYIKEKKDKYIQGLKDYLNSGAKEGFLGIGSSSSKGKEMSKAINSLNNLSYNDRYLMYKKMAEEFNKLSGEDIYNVGFFNTLFSGRMTGLADLTAEQLEILKKYDIWKFLDDATKDYINDLIEVGNELEDIEQQHVEWLTGLSAEDWQNNFLDGLLDIETTAEDVFNNISEHIRKAMIQHLVFSRMQDELTKFYDEYANYMGEAEGLTTQQRQEWLANYKERLQNLIEQGKVDTQAINELFPNLTVATRSASNNAFASMTQDQATKLEGMFTAVQGHTYDIRDYTHEMRDYAVIIQREISGIHVDTSAIVRLLGGVEDRMVAVNNRLRDFEMRGIRMQ